MTDEEQRLKIAKYLCRSYDNRWSSSRRWEDIPEESRNEWLIEATEIQIIIQDTTSEDYKDPFWPINK